MGEKAKVKLITVVWGARYVHDFARISLPSYLAAGNLPSLAEEVDLEILVMTTRASREAFEIEPAFRALRSICPVRFIDIDDLVTTGLYGVTLTMAYARGIQSCGASQVGTWFVLMNSDFVLADGGLKTLATRLHDDAGCILAPSLRARSEPVISHLLDAVDPERHTLVMRPREMVALAFANLHPTVIGKTVTQDFLSCTTHNQIYWQAGANTLLARYHLIFMLAIRPEVELPPVNSYCDYGFVPELVPSGRFSILDDSDDFFMLELQPTGQEKEQLMLLPHDPARIGGALSQWTTQEHRRFADVDVVFHSADLPADLSEQKAGLAAYVQQVRRHMAHKAVDHVDHFYWTSGVQIWFDHREKATNSAKETLVPPELSPHVTALTSGRQSNRRDLGRTLSHPYRVLLNTARHLRGQPPEVTVWHDLWADGKLVLDWAAQIDGRGVERLLLVHTPDSRLPGALGQRLALDAVELDALLEGESANLKRYEAVLVHITRSETLRVAELIDAADKLLAAGGTIAVYLEHTNYVQDFGNLSGELPYYIEDVFPSTWMSYRISMRMVGGRLKYLLRRIEVACMRRLWPGRLRNVPVALIAAALWPVVAGCTAVNNLWLRKSGDRHRPFCTSLLLTFEEASVTEPFASPRKQEFQSKAEVAQDAETPARRPADSTIDMS